MRLAPYHSRDLMQMLQLFDRTVHTVNAADYTQEQLDAWSDGHPDLERWDQSLQVHHTLLAWQGDELLGFADMAADGYLDRLYVSADCQHRGVGTALCDALEGACSAPAFTTHASITAKPFFLRRGYRVLYPQKVMCRGVEMTNFVMQKDAPKTD